MPKKPTFEQLMIIVVELQTEVNALRKENVALKEKLEKYENPKNSRNSSIPPSKDENRPKRNNSLRKKTGLKPGGQKGHKGKTLMVSDNPDIIKEILPDYCNKCGKDLSGIEGMLDKKRQIVDIPPIKQIITEYQTFSKLCSCGCTSKSDFPIGVGTPVSYGSNVQSLVAYLHARQFIPYKRMREMLNDLFGLSISQGGIEQLLKHFCKTNIGLYNKILAAIEKSQAVGGDETGCKVNGDKWWFWTWQTATLTFITASANRGKKTIDSVLKNGLPNSILVSDRWKPQLNTIAKEHQLCLAHLLRDTIYLNQLYNDSWTKGFKELLLDSIKLDKTMNTGDYNNPVFEKRKQIIKRFESLLVNYKQNKNYKKLNTFVKNITKLKGSVFVFLHYQDVPPDNNASERAVRNIKVKQKISGQFKSQDGAKRFAIIRSIIDTLTKNKLNVLGALNIFANFEVQTTG